MWVLTKPIYLFIIPSCSIWPPLFALQQQPPSSCPDSPTPTQHGHPISLPWPAFSPSAQSCRSFSSRNLLSIWPRPPALLSDWEPGGFTASLSRQHYSHFEIISERRLRSSTSHRLDVPPVPLSTVGRWAFPVSCTTFWNDLPVHVASAPSLEVFRQRLKTFLLSRSYQDTIIWIVCYYITIRHYSLDTCGPCNN